MRIESSLQMMQHIENGGKLALNNAGQLTTQSNAAHFFQKIGDAFCSLTAAGRTHIATRNANLHAAMSELVRQDTLINPTRGQAARPQLDGVQTNSIIMSLAMARGLAQLPEETRSAARALAEYRLAQRGIPQNGSAADVARNTREILESFRNTPTMRKSLTQDYSRTMEEMRPMLNAMQTDLYNNYIYQTREGNTNYAPENNGIHTSYFSDVERGSIASLNGNPPSRDHQGVKDELTTLIPDSTMRSFISYLAAQSGIEGCLTNMLQKPDGVRDHPEAADFSAMDENALIPLYTNHLYNISLQNNTATITLDMDVLLKTQTTNPQTLGGGHYQMTVTVDMAQDMTGKTVPDFSIVAASRTPILPGN